jgi:ubiquinone/menaquinone biosynthesis C-methylase UbiE
LSPGLDFVVGDMLALQYADVSLVGVVSFYSIVHFDGEQMRRAFAEIARVLVPNGLLALAFHVGRDTVHRDEWFGEPVNIDFSSHEPDVIVGQLADAGLVVDSRQERDPYAPAVEFQSRRC